MENGEWRMENALAMPKCNVCQAVNEQFHGNIVTLLLTAIGAEFLSFGVSSQHGAVSSSSSAVQSIHLLALPMLA